MDLVLKLNDQLKETKKELDNLIQSRQSELATTPQTVIPIVSTTVPSTLATSLAPTDPLATAMPVTGTSTSIETSTEKNEISSKGKLRILYYRPNGRNYGSKGAIKNSQTKIV